MSTLIPGVASRDLVQGKNEWRNIQEIVRTALTALYEAASHQSERIVELELDLKQKANTEDVNAALAQKASSFEVGSRLKKLQNVVAAKADEGVMEEQREGLEAALQASTSSLGSMLDTKADSIQIKSWLAQVDARISAVEESQIRTEQLTAQKVANARADMDARLAAQRADVDARLAKELSQIEFSCNAAMGEMVSAGIEQISSTSAAAGEGLRRVVEELKEQLTADMAVLKAESAELNTRTLTKVNAAMEQSRSLKAWREQQNLRILEMQAALTSLNNQHKAAATRAERSLEAAARELRAEAAAAQNVEARRLEAMLQHSTSLLRQSSVLGLATARATIVNDIESLRGEMEELKAEALQSPAPSFAAASPTAFQAFQSRLQRAGYDLPRQPPDEARSAASSSESTRAGHAATRPGAAGDDTPKESGQHAGSMEVLEDQQLDERLPGESWGDGLATPSSGVEMAQDMDDTSVKDAAWAWPEESAVIGTPQEAVARMSDQKGDEDGEIQGHSRTSGQDDGQTISMPQRSEPSVSRSEHAAPLSMVPGGVPGNPAIDASSAPLMSAGTGDSSAQAALAALVDQVIDNELRQEESLRLKWPGLSEEDLLEQEFSVPDQQAGEDPQEDDSAPRSVDARCHAAPSVQSVTAAAGTAQQQGEIHSGIAASPPAAGADACSRGSADLGRQPEKPRHGSLDSAADVRRRCDEALQLSDIAAQWPLPGRGEDRKSLSRSSSSEGAESISSNHAQPEEKFLSGSEAPAPRIADIQRSERVQTLSGDSAAVNEVTQMRAAMLAVQLAVADLASSSADLQRRMHDLEARARRSCAEPQQSPCGGRSSQSDIRFTLAEPASGIVRTPGEVKSCAGAYGNSKAGGDMLLGSSMHAQQEAEEKLPQHLLAIGRQMARMEAAMAALHQKLELLQGNYSMSNSGTGHFQGMIPSRCLEQDCWGNVSGEHAISVSLIGSGEQKLHTGVEQGPAMHAKQSSLLSLGARSRKGPMHPPGKVIARKIAAL